MNKQNVSLLKRAIAFLVDLYVGALLATLPISFVSLVTLKQMNQNVFLLDCTIAIIAILISLLLLAFYYIYIPCRIYQGQTLGKRLMDLKIETESINNLIKRQLMVMVILTSGGRLLAQLVSLVINYNLVLIVNDVMMYLSLIIIGMLFIKKETLHDKFFKTTLVECSNKKY